jgi:hypothetical protein
MSLISSGGRFGGYGANPQMNGEFGPSHSSPRRSWLPLRESNPEFDGIGNNSQGYTWGPVGGNNYGNGNSGSGNASRRYGGSNFGALLEQLLSQFGDMEVDGADKYEPGERWDPDSYDIAALKTSPHEVIGALRPLLTEERDLGFADAARRFGASGALVSTPYANELGQVERRSLQDMDSALIQKQFEAALYEAQAENTRRENALGRAYQGWAQYGQWGHEGQLTDMGYDQESGMAEFDSQQSMLMSLLPALLQSGWWE